MDDQKYLADGSAIIIYKKTDDGYLVQRIKYSYEYDEQYREYVDDYIFLVEKVFDKAPTNRQDKTISELESKIEELKETKRSLETSILEITKKEKETLKKFQKYEQLKQLNDYIDGKITHMVTTEYKLSLKTLKEFEDNYSGNGIRLLSLFGKSNGDLSWKINEYKDNSGCWYDCIPCCSYEDALEKLQIEINKILSNENSGSYKIDNAVKMAKEYGLNYDKEPVKRNAIECLKQFEKGLLDKQKELEEYKINMEKFKKDNEI